MRRTVTAGDNSRLDVALTQCCDRIVGACPQDRRRDIHGFCSFVVAIMGDVEQVSRTHDHRVAPLLNALTFNTTLIRDLWTYLLDSFDFDEFVLHADLRKFFNVSGRFRMPETVLITVATYAV